MTGLRARKRQQTHDTLSRVAIELFLARGFDQVSVTDIAAAADVSKPTLFKYFASKQDLALHRIADHAGEAARVVEASTAPPAEALLTHFLTGLDHRDPVTGLNDDSHVLAYYRLVFTTPALATHLHQFIAADQAALAAALAAAPSAALAAKSADGLAAEPSSGPRFDADLDAQLLAAYLSSTQQILARRNWEALSAGQSAAARHPLAVAEATRAFRALGTRVGP
ncbi:transcriptional regulator, TetR family [Kribbella flavida DSM 17836]|uniref:Transcriptional regulator, TetR family n=1 Tax=Kribbella flavida (strain DSM 17836 / JCM 10339 / NBRC 14399) TaxID=479435 RepID=D2PVB1_KRIFD|nr:TetR/AcrR family transcriptional regulator [Kribbella flavida]ADB33392.1 transcriptional regulator, TetR family [Kribbella flavida DSM 17836]